MELYSLKSKIEAVLSDACASIERCGVYTSFRTYFEDSKFMETDCWEKGSEYIVGELSVYTDNTPKDDALVYLISVSCKKGEINEGELALETESFMADISELISAIDGVEDAARYIDEHIEKINAEGEKIIADFENQIGKIKKISLIVSLVGIGVILLVWLLFLLF